MNRDDEVKLGRAEQLVNNVKCAIDELRALERSMESVEGRQEVRFMTDNDIVDYIDKDA